VAANALKASSHLPLLVHGFARPPTYGDRDRCSSSEFVVLTANPLTDIKNTRQLDSVWIGGRRLSTRS
jgi:hypothetical protein